MTQKDRLCQFVDPASRHGEADIAEAMGARTCPQPQVMDPPHSGQKDRICVACLYDWAEANEPPNKGVWGPVRTHLEILRR
ncbi:hypothetical protein EPO33_02925 [Patescibacteria group bacterium]|nr:MAG: hypothetical protein EPO33_02925 [Patescibacteria group bacterium]